MTPNPFADFAAYLLLGLAALLILTAVGLAVAWMYARAANQPRINHLPQRQPFVDALRAHREGTTR